MVKLLPQGLAGDLDIEKLREYMPQQHRILWQGNAVSAAKTFGTKKCVLCAKERWEIAKRMKDNPEKIINERTELFGACKHKPTFHRYCKEIASTKGGQEGRERVEETPQ